jgi:hypothetical protein
MYHGSVDGPLGNGVVMYQLAYIVSAGINKNNKKAYENNNGNYNTKDYFFHDKFFICVPVLKSNCK